LEAQGKKQVAAFDEMFRQLGKMPDFKVPEKEEEEGRRRKKEEGRRKKEEGRRKKKIGQKLMIFSSPSTSRTEFHL